MTKQTTVVFRKWKDSGEIIALFPEQPGDPLGNCGSYMHTGQHGAADFDLVVSKTTQAELNEYRQLLNELMEIGYRNFKILEVKQCP